MNSTGSAQARSTVVKRSVTIDGHKTSVSLENEFWTALKEIAASRGMTFSQLVGTIKREHGSGNLSSSLRLFVLATFRQRSDQRRHGKRKVLVVDDDPLVLDMAATMLEDLGCQVERAADGSAALAKIEADRDIEILITDVNMPGLSGFEVAERAKRRRENLHVILLSGREGDGHGLPFIRKPFLEADLTRVMRQTSGLC
jgi:predicted DNA-binding ribbon-helix-helix protein